MSDLLELATRCEQVTGPSRELDADIWRALDRGFPIESWRSYVTDSLDAAMSLVPEQCAPMIDWLHYAGDATGRIAWEVFVQGVADGGTVGTAEAATPALALCAAALRARHHLKQVSEIQDGGVAFGPGCQPSEQWRPIAGYEGLYEISAVGSVRSLRTGKLRALVRDTFGYLTVRLTSAEGEKRHSVHRLVCRAFHGEAPVGFHAAHLDGDPTNNRASNLAWASPKENNAHKRQHGTAQTGARHPRAKLTLEQVQQVVDRASAGETLRAIASDLGIHETHAGKIVAGKRWSAK